MKERYLGLGLHGEGPTDQRFLGPLLARLTSGILARHSRYPVVVAPIIGVATGAKQERASELSRAVGASRGSLDVLFVHADGAGDPEGAASTVVQPLIDRIVEDHADMAPRCVPVIPIREVEAWAIADPAAIAGLLRSRQDAAALGLPDDAAACELVLDPKAALEQAVARARSRTRRRSGPMPYEPLGERVGLERLERLSAFRKTREALLQVLASLRILTVEAP